MSERTPRVTTSDFPVKEPAACLYECTRCGYEEVGPWSDRYCPECDARGNPPSLMTFRRYATESAIDRRVYLMARAMARVIYPGISDEELERPAKRWNGTALEDGDCSVWQDFILEAEAALTALKAEGFVQ